MAADRLRTWLLREAVVTDSDVVLLGDWNEKPDSRTWQSIHELEKQEIALFSKVNDGDSISHLMYRNRSNIGSRLDMAMITMSAATQMVEGTEVVRWKSLDDLLAADPRASLIRKYIKEISKEVSDHMPVVLRFYMGSRNPNLSFPLPQYPFTYCTSGNINAGVWVQNTSNCF